MEEGIPISRAIDKRFPSLPPEPRSSRREEAHFSNAECGVRNAELSQSLLTSAAMVQGVKARNFSWKSLPARASQGEGAGVSAKVVVS